jgi:hypothetical protein
MKGYIIIFIVTVIVIVFVFFAFLSINKHDIDRCGGIYPNPKIAMCGVYSQKDFDEIACKDMGGLYIRGSNLNSGNCIFPPK